MWFLIIFVAIIIGLVLYDKYKHIPKQESKTRNIYSGKNLLDNPNILFCLIEEYNIYTFIETYNKKETYDNINLQYQNYNLLEFAILNDCSEIVSFLVDTGDFDVNKMNTYYNENGVFPLAQAVCMGNEEIVDILLKCQNINLNAKNRGFASIESFAWVSVTGMQKVEPNISEVKKKSVLKCVEKIISDTRYVDPYEYVCTGSELIEYAIKNKEYPLFRAYKKRQFFNLGLRIYDFITSETPKDIVNDVLGHIEETLIDISKNGDGRTRRLREKIQKETNQEEKDHLTKSYNALKKTQLQIIANYEERISAILIDEDSKQKYLDLFKKAKTFYRKRKI